LWELEPVDKNNWAMTVQTFSVYFIEWFRQSYSQSRSWKDVPIRCLEHQSISLNDAFYFWRFRLEEYGILEIFRAINLG